MKNATTRLLLVFAMAGVGFVLGFRLREEERVNLRRLIREMKELPFRLYV